MNLSRWQCGKEADGKNAAASLNPFQRHLSLTRSPCVKERRKGVRGEREQVLALHPHDERPPRKYRTGGRTRTDADGRRIDLTVDRPDKAGLSVKFLANLVN